MSLPSSDHYQYFSHLFHSGQLIPYSQYQPDPQWSYPDEDFKRFNRLFLTDKSYYQDCRILDLGCHTGYFSYVAKKLGAKSVHGINARQFPLDVANFAYKEFGLTDYTFEQGNIEDPTLLKRVCQNKDTVILTLTLEHLRNPYSIIETISNSDASNLVLESAVFSDEGAPALQYYQQSTDSAFSAYDVNRDIAIGSIPNVAWFDMILYFFGWRIEYHQVDYRFQQNWFAVPNLIKFPPRTHKAVTILCKKFSTDIGNNNYEN